MNSKQKELTIVFLFLFVLSFVIINWDDVSWIFNYKEVTGLAYDFFNPYQGGDILVNAQVAPIVNANGIPTTSAAPIANNGDNSITIGSLAITTPVVIGQTTDVITLEKALDGGAVYYPGSVEPGQNGQMIILGHSAPPNWPHIKHDYIFSDIQKLKIGDQITLTFNSVQYTYRVIGQAIINPGQDVPNSALAKDNNILTLVSCWPPGKSIKRIAVSAELIKS